MVSAPPTVRSPRRARSAETRRAPRPSPMRPASLPTNISYSPNPKARRAHSASPGVREWRGKRTPPRSAKRASGGGAGRFAKGLTSFLALQSLLKGAKVNAPYVGAPGKALAVWPLGSRVPEPYLGLTRTMAMNYPWALSKFPAVERTPLRRPRTCGRKACLAGQPNRSLYEPTSIRSHIYGTKVPRKFGHRPLINIPIPVISAANVLKFEAQGYQLPKSVLKQAHAGMPIIGNFKLSKNTKAAIQAKDPRLLPALMEAGKSIPSRFNRKITKNQLALPPAVQRKLAALEARAVNVATTGMAKALAAPWKVAAKARNLTGRAAASVGRGASAAARGARYAASLPGRGRRSLMRVLTAQERRLPN